MVLWMMASFFFFISWNDSYQPIVPYKTQYCETCQRHTPQSLIKQHRHLILLIPLYFTNRYYAVCDVCGSTYPVAKSDAKAIQSFYRSIGHLDTFYADIRSLIKHYEAIRADRVDQERLVFVKRDINLRYGQPSVPKDFLDYWVDDIAQQMAQEQRQDTKADQKDIEGRLRQLKDLRDQGLITDAEYEAKKREILRDL